MNATRSIDGFLVLLKNPKIASQKSESKKNCSQNKRSTERTGAYEEKGKVIVIILFYFHFLNSFFARK